MKSKQGGLRKGSGRKKRFGNDETTTISFRCPIKFREQVLIKINEILKEIEDGY